MNNLTRSLLLVVGLFGGVSATLGSTSVPDFLASVGSKISFDQSAVPAIVDVLRRQKTAQSIPFPGPGGPVFTFATWDAATVTGGGSVSGGTNLTYSSAGSASVVRSTKFGTGKFYYEISVTTAVSGAGTFAVGAIDSSQATATPTSIATVTNKMWLDRTDSFAMNNGTSSAYGSNYGAGSVMSIAVDNTLGSGSGKIWIGRCSGGTITWPSSGNPGTGANPMFSNLTGSVGALVNTQAAATTNITANFGATAFACNPVTNNASGFGFL